MKEENQSVQEPVAIVGNDYSLHWAGRGPIAPIIERHSIRPGSLLYAAPDVSGLVEALEKCLDFIEDENPFGNCASEKARAALSAYREQQAAPDVSGLVEGLLELRAMFPVSLNKQAFVVNGRPPLRADDDDEFYSAAKVNAALGKIRERIDAALSAYREQQGGEP